ncbi:AI-2E family transporter [Lentibacillus sp. L22]|uniref:AI-2E family transporter n=1 Tax=Lentibacillus TaxID=175304 RepID=UPI0022B1D295|nr:AI-2E family transporter [Lentibacillus daqui]
MYKKRWFQVLVSFILIFLLILLISATDFLFDPVFKYLAAVALPIVGAGVLFYLTKPIVHLMEKYKVPRVLAIFIVFILLILLIYLVIHYIAPIAQKQFSNLINNIPEMVEGAQSLISYWQANQDIIPANVNEAINHITSNLQSYIESAMSFLFGFISQLIGFVVSIVLIPFFLFFMLKDHDKFVPFITQIFHKEKAKNISSLMHKIDHTLSHYIQGQIICAVCVGFLLFIGYLIIGLNYALTLALFGMVMCVVPFAGAFISVIPAMIVGLFQEPIMAVWVAVIMIVAHQLESNLISPNIMGRALKLHPLTIITLVLAAGSIAGFLGILFAVPFYAVIKTIIVHFYKTYQDSKIDKNDALI